MSGSAAPAAPRPARSRWLDAALIAAGAGGLGAGLSMAGLPLQLWFVAFVVAAGLVVGALGLLMIGHLLSEEWLRPVRPPAEAIVLCAVLLFAMALPVAARLEDLYPWAAGPGPVLPGPRAAYLAPGPFLARGAAFLAMWTVLGFWVTRARNPRLASAVGLVMLAPTASFAAGDWVLSRDPAWWSSLFGFAFAMSQLLAALSLAILVALSRRQRPAPGTMLSLERASLTLALLVLWVWFVQFLIVWLGNLPDEAAWYLKRLEAPVLRIVLAVAVVALVLGIAVLAKPGFGRRATMAGSALLLIHHGAHMLWLIRPALQEPTAGDCLVALGLGLTAASCCGAVLHARAGGFAERPAGVP